MNSEVMKFMRSLGFSIGFVGLLWLIKGIERMVKVDFSFLGILPRSLSGTLGIITGPLVHGDMMHLVSNSFPLIFLGVLIFYFYEKLALEVFITIYILTGVWVWVIARDAFHIGASGISYGLVTFLFFGGLFKRSVQSVAVSFIILLLYGGMIHGIFPVSNDISWESHLMGSFSGMFCAIYFRKNYSKSTTNEPVVPEEVLYEQVLFPEKPAINISFTNASLNLTYKYLSRDSAKLNSFNKAGIKVYTNVVDLSY